MKERIKHAFDNIQADPELIRKTRDFLTGRKVRRQISWRRSLVAAALILTLSSLITLAGMAAVNTTVAAVSIDINPSIELDINILDRVIAARSFNERGKEMLDELDLANVPIKDAIGKIIAASAKAGYLASDGSSIIAIISSTDNKSLKSRLELIADESSRKVLTEESQRAVIYNDNTALARVAEARSLGNVTPGKLNLIQRLIELDPSKQVSDLVDSEISDIMKQIVSLEKEKGGQAKETGKTNHTPATTTSGTGSQTTVPEISGQEQTRSKMEQALEQSQSNHSRNSQPSSN
jgi:hypothetical protein